MKKSGLLFSVEFTEDKYNAADRDLGAVVRIAVVAEIGTGLWSVVRVGRRTAGGGRRSRRWEGLAASGHCCGKSSSSSASVLSG